MTPDEIKAAVFGLRDRQVYEVPTPEWADVGLAVCYVTPMGLHGRDRYDQHYCDHVWPEDEKGNPLPADWRGIRGIVLAETWCDAEGNLLAFTDLELVRLGEKNSVPLDRLYQKGREISGLGKKAEEAAKKN